MGMKIFPSFSPLPANVEPIHISERGTTYLLSPSCNRGTHPCSMISHVYGNRANMYYNVLKKGFFFHYFRSLQIYVTNTTFCIITSIIVVVWANNLITTFMVWFISVFMRCLLTLSWMTKIVIKPLVRAWLLKHAKWLLASSCCMIPLHSEAEVTTTQCVTARWLHSPFKSSKP